MMSYSRMLQKFSRRKLDKLSPQGMITLVYVWVKKVLCEIQMSV